MKHKWETVIGLEIHAQLKTRTKLFSGTPNSYGAEPNTHIGIVDTGQPGALPVLNREAVKKAVMFGLSIQAEVPLFSQFDRKSYFYPDSPRNFQITQFEHPIVKGGHVEAGGKTFTIHHAHLEDDAGMLRHFTHFSGVDYNRAGVPLLEIVSDPCIRSGKEATLYATAIRAIMQYLGAADCNMEEGGMRFDVNISVRPEGSTELRTKTEIKNLNSFMFMEQAIEAETKRQIQLYEAGGVVKSATYRFDVEGQKTIEMRTKEQAADYLYFPDPDLPPLILSREWIEEIRRSLPELPAARFKRYLEELHLSMQSAELLISDKTLSDLFEEGLKFTPHAQQLSNWLTVEFVGRIKETEHILPPLEHIAELVNLIESKAITGKIAKKVADDMLKTKEAPSLIIRANPDYTPLSDTSAITPLIEAVLTENPQSIIDYHAGKDRAFNFLVGQIMKRTQGAASPDVVKELLLTALQNKHPTT
ncbi:MAG: Asp-tRNA(Asn)/Glu-tRNA(Gln) amidotransferase subunit GatB [Simkaniaceae bacterium]|nr:Asp-tRNA(Asn)/Glu-tRNA(Gln) amidotransferase subunit GatB [Simkaniaceae bacterium]